MPALRGRTVLNLFYEASSTRTRSRSSSPPSASRRRRQLRAPAARASRRASRSRTRSTRSTPTSPTRSSIRTPWAGAAAPRRAVDAAARRQRRRRQARAPDPGAARRLHAPPARSATLDGAHIWIVGDVLHSRVARSNILAFQRMGARVTVCGPPTLIPRGIEALGCDVALHARRPARGRRRLRAADAERAHDRAPSCRRCASTPPRTRSTAERCSRARSLMHPGPVNRGVELSGEVVDSPQAVITMPGRGRHRRAHGGALRAARRRAPRPGPRRAPEPQLA